MSYWDYLEMESEKLKIELEEYIKNKYNISTKVMQKELVKLANELCSAIYCQYPKRVPL